MKTSPQSIRLTAQDLSSIKEAFKLSFLPEDHLWLFGSRVDITKRGGDIDLYIETAYETAEEVADARRNFLLRLFYKLGEQRIDVVIKMPNKKQLLIYEIAREEGVLLV